MESLAQALAALSIADRLRIIEEAITTQKHINYLEMLLELIEQQKAPIIQE